MNKHFFTLCALIAALVLAPLNALAVTGSSYPSQVVRNQFGETSINSIIGGSQPDCVFTVNAADSAGKGITGLSGPLCSSVFMFTSQTPATGNPNPAAGYIVVNLKSGFYGFDSAYMVAKGQTSGSAINVTSGVTAGNPYTISAPGTTTSLSQWQHLGLPSGVTPAVGAAFIATSTTTATGNGTVMAPGTVAGGISMLDVIGLPASGGMAAAGGQVILRVSAATNSSTTTLAAKAPVDGTVIGLHFILLPLSSQLN